MKEISKELTTTLAEDIEGQPQSHTNYGYSSQSSLDPDAKIISKNNEKQKEQMSSNPQKSDDPHSWRDLIAYWILGLCNNFGYVIMLSAAHDIIGKFSHHSKETTDLNSVKIDESRECHIMSTGVILLADIIPSLIAKATAPFLPFWVHVRIFISIMLALCSFLLVPFANSQWIAILGVICTSFSCGLGETTFLSYSSFFNKNVISTWSSGTGGAGVIGSLCYAALARYLGPENAILSMIIIPIIEGLAFWILLRNPKTYDIHNLPEISVQDDSEINVDDEKPLITLKEKIFYCVKLFKYMLPLTSVYLFEYFINQGLFELVNFEGIFLTKEEQYRWLNVDYQIGVFVSRSSVNLLRIKKTYLLSLFQFINVIYFLIEVIFLVTPNIWIVFIIVFWEGLLGGGAYVNTFYNMSKEVPKSKRVFAIGVVAQSDSYGIALSGILAMPVHNAICKLPKSIRWQAF